MDVPEHLHDYFVNGNSYCCEKTTADELGAKYAITDSEGTGWYVRDLPLDKYHREDGPAIERSDGYKAWYKFGKRHRIGGPAIISTGRDEYYVDGKLHREDGPAVEHVHGDCYWFYHGEEIKIPLIYSEKAALEFFKLRILELKVQSVLDS